MKKKGNRAPRGRRNDIYHRWKEVQKLNGKGKNQCFDRKPKWISCRRCG